MGNREHARSKQVSDVSAVVQVGQLYVEGVVGVLDKLPEMGAGKGVARLEMRADPEQPLPTVGKEATNKARDSGRKLDNPNIELHISEF